MATSSSCTLTGATCYTGDDDDCEEAGTCEADEMAAALSFEPAWQLVKVHVVPAQRAVEWQLVAVNVTSSAARR